MRDQESREESLTHLLNDILLVLFDLVQEVKEVVCVASERSSSVNTTMEIYRCLGLVEHSMKELHSEKLPFWQPWRDFGARKREAKLPNKELPTTKWRRERRRLSEYQTQSGSATMKNGGEGGEAPLDMTITSTVTGVKPRSPPPYREPLPGSTFALSFTRPTVITQAPKTQLKLHSATDQLPDSISMCDTVIDEHFRRSLGNNYMALFSKNPSNNASKQEDEVDTTDAISLSVDDHFAKALGDTWQKIKATADTGNCSGKRRESEEEPSSSAREDKEKDDQEEVTMGDEVEIKPENNVSQENDDDQDDTFSSSSTNSQVTNP
ncbi:hypothetical protein DMENIID0001_010720 [Sergentomyia squamirostris]